MIPHLYVCNGLWYCTDGVDCGLGYTPAMAYADWRVDKRPEEVSEKIRMGIPVGMYEAIEAIEYQRKLKANRDAKRAKALIWRLMRWIRGA